MTVLFNVTDAIGTAPNHGITRTERRLATALAGRTDVEFVLVRGHDLWQVDATEILPLLDRPDVASTPHVERFGVDDPPRAPSAVAAVVDRVRRRTPAAPSDPSFSARSYRSRADDVLVSVGLDWVHGTLDIAERHVFGAGGRFVGLSYDLIPIDHPEWLFPPDVDGFRAHLRRLLRVADSVMCISASTQSDLLRHFPDVDRTTTPVITLGADAATHSGSEHRAFAASMFDGAPYVIYCATVDRRKNHRVLYRAVRELVDRGIDGNVLFVGRVGSGVDDLIDSMRHDRSIAGRIALVTDCDDRHLAALYERSVGAVYPSLYEGWGLGVTEALAHGRPCVVATGSSLGEAGLGACREVHPLRTGAWADAMQQMFAGQIPAPAVDLPTWESAAAQVLEVATR